MEEEQRALADGLWGVAPSGTIMSVSLTLTSKQTL